MIENFGQNGRAQGVHRTCTARAPLWCILACMALPVSAQAGTGWDAFVARCLDPFEHQALAIVDGLRAQPADQMQDAVQIYAAEQGAFVLMLDPAPEEGERACVVETTTASADAMAQEWMSAQVASGRYTKDAGWLVSNEWIEPRVMVRIEDGAFRVVETDFES